jgi:hypothetical protein
MRKNLIIITQTLIYFPFFRIYQPIISPHPPPSTHFPLRATHIFSPALFLAPAAIPAAD